MGDNNKSSTKVIMVFVAGAIIGLLLGAYGGSQFGMALVLNNSLQKNAVDVHWQVKTLRQLRAGQIDQVIESVESHLDDDLILFDPQEPYSGVRDDIKTQVEGAITSARGYRIDQPRQSSRPHVDAMVSNLFKKN